MPSEYQVIPVGVKFSSSLQSNPSRQSSHLALVSFGKIIVLTVRFTIALMNADKKIVQMNIIKCWTTVANGQKLKIRINGGKNKETCYKN